MQPETKTPLPRACARATAARRQARAGWALALFALASAIFFPLRAPAQSLTRHLFGTCVSADSTEGIPDVRVVFLPDSTVVTTDLAGDFILEWSGTRGWVEIERSTLALCKRIVVDPDDSEGDLDLGLIEVQRGNLRISRQASLPPGWTSPDTVRTPGYSGPAERHWFTLFATFDIWGKTLGVYQQSGDPAPDSLAVALAKWMGDAPWQVRPESRCDDPAFQATIPMAYIWDSSGEFWVRDSNNRP